jgi:hypothetical protein
MGARRSYPVIVYNSLGPYRHRTPATRWLTALARRTRSLRAAPPLGPEVGYIVPAERSTFDRRRHESRRRRQVRHIASSHRTPSRTLRRGGRLHSRMCRRRSEKSEANLLVVSSPKLTLGQVRRDDALLSDRIAPVDTTFEECVSSQAHEDFAPERVVLRVQWPDGIERIEDVCSTLECRQEKINAFEGVCLCRGTRGTHACSLGAPPPHSLRTRVLGGLLT